MCLRRIASSLARTDCDRRVRRRFRWPCPACSDRTVRADLRPGHPVEPEPAGRAAAAASTAGRSVSPAPGAPPAGGPGWRGRAGGLRSRMLGRPADDACSLAVHALAALMRPIIALTALAALGLSGPPFHEPFHTQGHCIPSTATVRNIAGGLYPRSGAGRRSFTDQTPPRIRQVIVYLRRFGDVRSGPPRPVS